MADFFRVTCFHQANIMRTVPNARMIEVSTQTDVAASGDPHGPLGLGTDNPSDVPTETWENLYPPLGGAPAKGAAVEVALTPSG